MAHHTLDLFLFYFLSLYAWGVFSVCCFLPCLHPIIPFFLVDESVSLSLMIGDRGRLSQNKLTNEYF
uniref:Putative secreted protein n=1 Tax=Anopheles darlingi TaxID=43151 RepID=A0A2M4DHL0_ANODA